MKLTKSIRFMGMILSGLWLMFVTGHRIFSGQSYLWNVFGSLPAFCFGLIPVCLLIYEVSRRKRHWLNMLMIALAFILGATQLDINLFPMKNEKIRPNQYTEIKVFNWNTCFWDQYKDQDRYYRFLRKQRADIYILQEYLYDSIDWTNSNSPARMRKSAEKADGARLFSICSVVPGFSPHYLAIDARDRIAQEFPGYHIRTNLQFVLISRFPIEEAHADYSEQYAVYDIDIQGRPVRFFNVHMLLHVQPGNPFVPSFYRELKQRYVARRLGFKNLQEDIRKTRGAYFIAGDFNSTTAMGVMDELLKAHVDAARYSSELIPLSFEFSGLRFWRFDYGLAPKNNDLIRIKTYQNLDQEGLSDHNPQMLVLGLKTAPERTAPTVYSPVDCTMNIDKSVDF